MECEDLKSRYTRLFQHYEQLVAEEKAEPGSVSTGVLRAAGEASFEAGILYRECIDDPQPVVALDGEWLADGFVGPVISTVLSSISINMSRYNRPKAFGMVLDPTTISVTFPDDATYTAKLVKETFTAQINPPEFIRWSNDTQWSKVYPRLVTGHAPLNELVAQ